MVFDVTRARVSCFALELIEKMDRILAKNVDKHIEAPAVSHSDTDFFCSVTTDPLDCLSHHWHQTLSSLESESLGTRIF